MRLELIQKKLAEQQISAWLLFDHHIRDPIAYRVLGFMPQQHVTRRWYYLIPASGEPQKLVHRIESKILDSVPGNSLTYSSWAEQTARLSELLTGFQTVAMQYSPLCAIPYISNVDGGTVDLIRSFGVEVVSAAELIQFFEATLDETALRLHMQAGEAIDQIRADAFRKIRDSIANNIRTTEWETAQFIRNRFSALGLVTDSGPIVAVDAHSGDPHYEPNQHGSTEIQSGSFVLIDLWAKLNQPGAIYYDVTWTGFCGQSAPDRIVRVFDKVCEARNAATRFVTDSVRRSEAIRGFQVDDTARTVIADAGFGEQFVHRTGHSIGANIHANGANMDNLETHDDRLITPWSCFSIEPGIYLPEFGIRSEVNMFIDAKEARVTGAVQDRLILI